MAGLTTQPAFASDASQPDSVQAMREWCHATMDDPRRSACIAFVSGIGSYMIEIGVYQMDTTIRQEYREALTKVSICPKEAVSGGQFVQVFLNWSDKNPKEWQSTATAGVFAALIEAWPCSSP